MVITTNRLSIICTNTDEWVQISVYPRTEQDSSHSEPIIIKYDENSLESDIELETIIGLFNGEPTWRRQYLEGYNIENEKDTEMFYSYVVPKMELKAKACKKLDFFSIRKLDFWNKGLPEIYFITDDLLAGKNSISVKTAIRLEALKYSRLALGNCEDFE